MKTVMRCLIIGLLVAGVAAGCGDGASGDQPKPDSSSSQEGDGGGY